MAEPNELTCEQIREFAASERYGPAVLAHIQRCDRCLDSLLGVLMHDQLPEVPDDFARRVLAQAPPPERSGIPSHTAIAAGGALLFALAVAWYRSELIALTQTLDGILLLAAIGAQTMFITVFIARLTRI
jgi:hypothetical protein